MTVQRIGKGRDGQSGRGPPLRGPAPDWRRQLPAVTVHAQRHIYEQELRLAEVGRHMRRWGARLHIPTIESLRDQAGAQAEKRLAQMRMLLRGTDYRRRMLDVVEGRAAPRDFEVLAAYRDGTLARVIGREADDEGHEVVRVDFGAGDIARALYAALPKTRQDRLRCLDHSDPARFNPAGVIEVRVALRAVGVPLVEETETGLEATDKQTLLRAVPYASEPAVRFVMALIAPDRKGRIEDMGWRPITKLASTYLDLDKLRESGRLMDDGRLHVDWLIHGTVTGRFSSSPNLRRGGCKTS